MSGDALASSGPYLTWSAASEDLVVKVFLCLSPAERGLARQVCKRWDLANSHPALLRNSVLKLVGSFGGLSLRYLAWNERIRHLHVVNVDNSQWCMQLSGLGEGDGGYVEQLVLENCSITFATFTHMLSVFSNLRTLNITGCNSLFMTGQLTSSDATLQTILSTSWNRLRCLELGNVSYLNDDNFAALFQNTNQTTLDTVTLRSIKLAYYLETMTRGSLLCFSTLLTFIKSRASLLSSLTVDYSNVTDTMLIDLSKVEELKLRHVSVVSCRDVTDRGMVPFVISQSELLSIDMSQLKEITAKVVLTIEESCKHLRTLRMSKCNSIVGRKTIPTLNSLPLRHLNVSECHRIDSVDLYDLTTTQSGLPALEILEMENFGVISEKLFPMLSTVSSKLQTLKLCSVPGISLQSMISIYSNLTDLKCLKLAWTNSVNDDLLLGTVTESRRGRRGQGQNCCSDKEGEQKCCCDFTSDLTVVQSMESKCPLFSTVNISNLSKLESLDLSSCNKISDLSIIHTFRFPHLRHLSLSMCTHVTDASVEALCLNCGAIERLNLSYTPVTDAGIKLVSKRLKILRALFLTNCVAITDSAIGYLEAYAFQLNELDVSLCPGITMEQINHFQRSVPTVHSIKSRFISSGTFIDT